MGNGSVKVAVDIFEIVFVGVDAAFGQPLHDAVIAVVERGVRAELDDADGLFAAAAAGECQKHERKCQNEGDGFFDGFHNNTTP